MNREEIKRDEIVSELGRLIEASALLRDAMLRRDSDRILALVEEAETWTPSVALRTATPEALKDESIGALAKKLRRLQESNRLLSNAFVKLYRNILHSTEECVRGASGLYGRAGQTEPKMTGPMLINQIG